MSGRVAAAVFGAVAALSAGAEAAGEPVYSSIKPEDCVLYDLHEVGAASACRGVGGYSLAIEDGDLRIYLKILHPGWEFPAAIDLMKITGGSFSSLPSGAVEWRGPKDAPTAMILRVGFNEGDGRPGDQALAVVRLDKTTHKNTCLVAAIPRGPEMNEEARKIADQAAVTPCL